MPPSSTVPNDAPPWARPRLERQIDMLGELAEAGLVMALDVKDEAQALKQAGPVEPAVLEGLSRAFGRTSRSVRLTLMLQERLIMGLIAFDAGGGVAAPEDRVCQDNRPHQVVRIIIHPHDDVETRERLVRETMERLDREDLEGGRPLTEPFSLEGGRAGMGVNAPASTQKTGVAPSTPPREILPEPPLHSPPSPTLPPSRGNGDVSATSPDGGGPSLAQPP
jgi:hypothetical protein